MQGRWTEEDRNHMLSPALSNRDRSRYAITPGAGFFLQWGRDCIALIVLTVLVGITIWNRFTFDAWLTRLDILTQFLPWYAELGERLRASDIPAWNPYIFSGTPFAGHPLTGWMYLPAMLTFPFFAAITAFKTMIAAQLVLAALSTYVFARVLGMGTVAALVAAIVYACGPLLQWNTHCCLQFAQFAIWVPLALLGIELALRGWGWRERILPWFVAGFALSQMFAGWVGEGWLYAIALTIGYTAWRGLLTPLRPERCLRARFFITLVTGAAMGVIGAMLGAAGILPRLAVNAQTSLAGADYARLGDEGILNPPWSLDYLLTQILGIGTGYHFRAAGMGGAVIILALLAPLLARNRFAVPFFAILTIFSLMLTLDTTPLHELVYLIPRYEALHVHDPWRVIALASIGPAMLCGATIDSLTRWRGYWYLLLLIPQPFLVLAELTAKLNGVEGFIGWAPLLAAALVTVLIMAIIAVPRRNDLRWIPRLVLGLIVAVVFVQPTGLELTGSWLGWPRDSRWQETWHPDPMLDRILAVQVRETDPGGAAGFLQAQLDGSAPFRYVGYGGTGYQDGGPTSAPYTDRPFDTAMQAILVNNRAMFLDLYSVQGYDPIQLSRYVEFMEALNGRDQNYHTAYVLSSGVQSPLLDLLNVRYVVVDGTLPADRDDVAPMLSNKDVVFNDGTVVVFENRRDLPHAWIVHDVRSVERGEALPLLVDGSIDPWQTALVEGSVADIAPATDPAAESALVTRYQPDRIDIETTATAPGMLVISEVYADGWRATVDGEAVDILPTDHVLRGVPIPAGVHTVELKYEPLALRVGMFLTGITAIAMVVAFLATCWWRHTGQTSPWP